MLEISAGPAGTLRIVMTFYDIMMIIATTFVTAS